MMLVHQNLVFLNLQSASKSGNSDLGEKAFSGDVKIP